MIICKKSWLKDCQKEKIVGKHDGLMYYTLRQRKGFGIGGGKGDGSR